MSHLSRSERLSEIADLNPRFRESVGADEEVSFIPMSAVESELTTVDDQDVRRYSEVSKGYTPFATGDLLFAKITPCFENGKIAQARLRHRLGFGSTEFHVVRPHASQVDARYLLHFLRLPRIRRDGERRMTGSAGQRRVPENLLADLEVPLPPLAEQRRIAEVLDRAEALRAKRRAALAQLDTLTQAIFLDMFGDPASNPKGWPVRQLDQVVKDGTIVTYGIVQAGDEFDGGVPYIRTGDIVDGEIAADGLRHTDPQIAARFGRSRVSAGDIVMSIRATVGTTAVVPAELEGANLTQGTARISVGSLTRPSYLLSYLRAPGTQHWIAQQVKGATFREITLSRLRELPVAIPPKELQAAFQRRYESLQRLRTLGQSSLIEFEALFASLQDRAFHGEL